MTIPPITASSAAPLAAPRNSASATQASAAATTDVSATTTAAPSQPPASLDALLALVKQSAAARQDGLALLMANALRAAATTTLPDPLQTALDQLLALHLPTDQPPDAAAVKAALQTSGLFTEANLAAATTRLPVDVKTALLQMNQAAEAWIARAALASDPKLEKASSPVATPPPTRSPEHSSVAASASPPKGEVAAPNVPMKTTGTPIAGTTSSPTPTMIPPEIPAKAALPPAPAQTKAATGGHISQPPPRPQSQPSAATTATTSTAAHSGPATVSPPVPNAFKPVLQLLEQALQTLTPEPSSQVPSAKPLQNAAARPVPPATRAAPGASQQSTPVQASPPIQIKAAMALLAQAIEIWPTTPPAPEPLPESVALAVPTKIAAQTIATAPLATAPLARSAEPDGASAPPEITAVLAKLEHAIVAAGARLSDAAAHDTPARPAGAAKATSTQSGQDAATRTAQGRSPVASADSRTVVRPATPVEPPISGPQAALVGPSTPGPVSMAETPDLPAASPNDVRALLSLLSRTVENAPEPSSPPANGGRPAQPSVPPPMAGAPSKAQGAAAPTLPEKADIALIAKTLAAGSDAALARQTLLQLASLPDGSTPARSNQARWIIDLPVMTSQGPAVAQLAIERDGRNTTPEQPKPVWRVQFAMDIAPLGPVRASMALSGGQAWVTVHAERDEAIDKLRAQMSWLAGALQDSDLDANIAVEQGRSASGSGRAAPLVDRAS